MASTPATAAKRAPPHFRFRSAAPFGVTHPPPGRDTAPFFKGAKDPEGMRRKQRWLPASPLPAVGHKELRPDFGVETGRPSLKPSEF